MKKKRYTEEQIIGFLREADAGVPVKELCRKHGFSEASYYLWRGKFGGMEVSDAKRLKALEAQNAKLKKLLAEASWRRRSHAKRCEKSGERTGSTRAGALDDTARVVRTSGAEVHRHERELVALPACCGSQRRFTRADRIAGAASPPLWRRDDLSEAATGRPMCEPQASRSAVRAGEAADQAAAT